MVSIELAELWRKVEGVMRDGIVTECERKQLEARYAPLQLRAKTGAVMQKAGLRIARVGRCDKNIVTEIKALCAEIEEATNSVDLKAA
jgi:branched-subunit amino acid aminotransferase/4-amino-4-deoxychorismate lyase